MKTSKEMTQIILEALEQTNHPMKGLIQAVLEKWELQIRKNELEINQNPYNQS